MARTCTATFHKFDQGETAQYVLMCEILTSSVEASWMSCISALNKMPQLTSLKLNSVFESPPSHDRDWSLLQNLTNLKELTICIPKKDISFGMPPNLTSLSLHTPYPKFLTPLPHLETLHYEFSDLPSMNFSTLYPNLRKLVLKNFQYAIQQNLASVIYSKTITHLEINSGDPLDIEAIIGQLKTILQLQYVQFSIFESRIEETRNLIEKSNPHYNWQVLDRFLLPRKKRKEIQLSKDVDLLQFAKWTKF